jgi:hypothetical protein
MYLSIIRYLRHFDDTPDTKLALACSGEARRRMSDFSAAYAYGSHSKVERSLAWSLTHLTHVRILPSCFGRERLASQAVITTFSQSNVDQATWRSVTRNPRDGISIASKSPKCLPRLVDGPKNSRHKNAWSLSSAAKDGWEPGPRSGASSSMTTSCLEFTTYAPAIPRQWLDHALIPNIESAKYSLAKQPSSPQN